MQAGALTVAFAGLGVTLAAMTLLWLASLRLRDASIADPFWGPGFALVTATYFTVDGRFGPRGTLALALVVAWAARLGWHLLRRNRREGEDPRYQAMRARHGDRFGRVSLFSVFWLQGGLLWIISAPLFGAIVSESPLGPWDVAGTLVFAVGLALETIADLQLKHFRADPSRRGTVLDTGLWRYSRHPNYFGEAVLWWGLGLLGVGSGAWVTLVGPALITFLLLRVSGVTMLEEGLKKSKPGYEEYVRRTSAFVPMPPRG
jgi:steroid 5-alpha reductase family enzyme